MVYSYEANERQYEIWAGSLADPQVRLLLDRVQVLVSLFIEAGTPLDTDDPEWSLERWTVFFVYVYLSLLWIGSMLTATDTRRLHLQRQLRPRIPL